MNTADRGEKFRFHKYHGLGNDFIIFDLKDTRHLKSLLTEDKIKFLCDRHFGIGADGILLLEESNEEKNKNDNISSPDYNLTIYNSDGSTAEMCGNGVRCITHYLKDIKIIDDKITLKTGAGNIKPRIMKYCPDDNKAMVKVNMGVPKFSLEKIPVRADRIITNTGISKEKLINVAYDIFSFLPQAKFTFNLVSMGNPHAVFFVEEKLSKIPLETWGPKIETHEIFPENINVEFAEVEGQKRINLQVWERGSGITLACGTGASATAAAAIELGLTKEMVDVVLPGGSLSIDWSQKDLYIIGPSNKVFSGKINL